MNTAITNSSSHWNVGGWTVGSNVKDIEFIDTVIELIKNKINENMSFPRVMLG